MMAECGIQYANGTAAELQDTLKNARAKYLRELQAFGAKPPVLPPKPTGKKTVKHPGSGITKEEADQYLPPNCKIRKEESNYGRWCLMSPLFTHLMRKKAKKHYGKEKKMTDWDAMVFLLRAAWAAESARGVDKTPCPWIFETENPME